MSAELPRLPGLDGLRAVAAVLVVLTHVGFLTGAVSFGVVGRLLGRGDLGVSIFFALSGFLLYAAMGREWARTGRVDVPAYYARRAVRVLPAFWVGLLVVGSVVRPEVWVWLANASLTHIYVPDALLDGYTQTWSLATEVSFYLVLPFAFLALRRRTSRPSVALRVLAATWVLGLVVRRRLRPHRDRRRHPGRALAAGALAGVRARDGAGGDPRRPRAAGPPGAA